MSEIQSYDQLFMLEILVENLRVKETALNCVPAELSLSLGVKFGSLPCFDLTHDEPNAWEIDEDTEGTRLWKWNRGKSCVFTMDPTALAACIQETPLRLALRSKRGYGSNENIIIGTSEVSLGSSMARLARDAAQWLPADPVGEAYQDRFTLVANDGRSVGSIEITLRLTCLGTTVFTNIQVSAENKFHFQKEDRPIEPNCKVCAPGKPIVRGKDNPPPAIGENEIVQEKTYEDATSPYSPQINPSRRTTPLEYRTNPPRRATPFGSPVYQSRRATPVRSTALPNQAFMDKTVRNKSATFLRKGCPSFPKKTAGFKLSRPKVTPAAAPIDIKRRRRQRFCPGPQVDHPGVILGHTNCQALGPLVPAQHGWAWPAGLKQSDFEGWRPGYFQRDYLRSLKHRPIVKEQRRGKRNENDSSGKAAKMQAPATLKLVRAAGLCTVLYAPTPGQPAKRYTYPDDSDASDLEMDVTMPDLPQVVPPLLRDQSQQFCEEDLPLVKTPRKINPGKKKKPVKKSSEKKKKLKEVRIKVKSENRGNAKSSPQVTKKPLGGVRDNRSEKKGNQVKVPEKKAAKKLQQPIHSNQQGKKRAKETKVKVYPWDNWIMKLDCQDDLKKLRPIMPKTKKAKGHIKK